MTTERDVYIIDTDQAVDGIKDLSNALNHASEDTEKVKKSTENLSAFMAKDFTDSMMNAQRGYDALKASLEAIGKFIAEGAKDFIEGEQATMRLSVALQNHGFATGQFLADLDRQSSVLQRTTGLEDDYIRSLQTLLVTMGVAPGELQRFTKAALDLSAATGVDAMNAAKQLARAHAEGADDLKKYGIQVDAATFKAQGFSAVLAQVETRFGGLSGAINPATAGARELEGAFKDFKESVGQVAVELVTGSDSVLTFQNVASGLALTVGGPLVASFVRARTEGVGLADVLDGLSEFLTSKNQKAAEEYAERTVRQTELTDQYIKSTEYAREELKKFSDLLNKGLIDQAMYDEKVNYLKGTIRAIAEESNKLGTALKLDADPFANKKIAVPESLIDTGVLKAKIAAEKEAAKREAAEAAANAKSIAKARQDAFFDGLKEENNARKKAHDEFSEEQKKRAESDRALKIAVNKQAEQDAIDAANAEIEIERNKAAERRKIIEDFAAAQVANGQQFVATQLGFLKNLLMSNTQAHRQMQQMTIDRMTAGMSESDANAKRTEIEKQLASQRTAAWLQVTADALASIAQQSATKAIFEGAEAIAAAARYDYPSAAQHGVAAAAYGAVAIGAGGIAVALQSARPLTADEQGQIDAQTRADNSKDRSTRDAAQAAQATADAATKVNVYYLGITGQTEQQQGKELARIQAEYNTLRTGGG